MTSAIDTTKPVQGSPTTQSVRDNFAAAKNEILDLQLVRAVRVASISESVELFQPCAVNNTPQVVAFNNVTYTTPVDLTRIEFDTLNNELIYKDTGWYHGDLAFHVVRKTSGTTLNWSFHTQIKTPSGSFTNFPGGLRILELDGAVANQEHFFHTTFIFKVEEANTRLRLMQTCSDVTKNCGIIAYPAVAPLPSAAGAILSSHRIGPL